jgi:hypothetical protein
MCDPDDDDDDIDTTMHYHDIAMDCLTAMLVEFRNQMAQEPGLDRHKLYKMLIDLIRFEASTLDDGNNIEDLYATEEESAAKRRLHWARLKQEGRR